jgi:hypothetical protein
VERRKRKIFAVAGSMQTCPAFAALMANMLAKPEAKILFSENTLTRLLFIMAAGVKGAVLPFTGISQGSRLSMNLTHRNGTLRLGTESITTSRLNFFETPMKKRFKIF